MLIRAEEQRDWAAVIVVPRGERTLEAGPARNALLRSPVGVVADAAGNIFFVDRDNSRVRRIAAVTNFITTRVGTGPPGSVGDGGPATVAALNFPYGIAVSGNRLYVVEEASNRVRKVDLATGVITAFAGTGEAGPRGDGGPALAAGFTQPTGLAVDRNGNVYIADNANHRIRKVDANTNVITTVAGNGDQGNSGDNGLATAASLAYPNGIAVDSAGNIYIADQQNRKIRRVDTSGIITTYAGNGQSAYAGDNGQAVAASFITPNDIAVDSAGNLFVADLAAYVIRRIDAVSKVITTVAGTGRSENSGDGGAARQASLVYPNAVALDSAGNLFIADYYTVRRVDAATQTISTVAGTGEYGFSGDNVPAFDATVDAVRLAFDAAGNLFITDRLNHRIRAVRGPVNAPK
ncbi:MAG: SBBP repeat-containing protein [Acidobacteriota bacterium]